LIQEIDISTGATIMIKKIDRELICLKCGSKMIIKTNRYTKERFWACSRYPDCKHTDMFIDYRKMEAFKNAIA
jgi:ssDNA-binding Zn-finger/Zn-ribbon topoisomerase 1